MKVILQETMEGVGHLGDLIDVKDGFARNFLLPRKKAVVANDRNIKSFEHSKRVAAERAKKEKLEIEAHAKKMSTVTLTVEAQVGNLGINLGVAAPIAMFPFSGWKGSFFGDLHAQGRDGVEFYTDKKVVIERWPAEWSRVF